MSVYDVVAKRSGGRCEAMIYVYETDVWTRCGRSPVHMHHMLLRARGGEALDRVGETYHLVALCPRCHQMAHEDRTSGLIIDGYVEEAGDGSVVYVGTNSYLQSQYGKEDHGVDPRTQEAEGIRQGDVQGAGA